MCSVARVTCSINLLCMKKNIQLEFKFMHKKKDLDKYTEEQVADWQTPRSKKNACWHD